MCWIDHRKLSKLYTVLLNLNSEYISKCKCLRYKQNLIRQIPRCLKDQVLLSMAVNIPLNDTVSLGLYAPCPDSPQLHADAAYSVRYRA